MDATKLYYETNGSPRPRKWKIVEEDTYLDYDYKIKTCGCFPCAYVKIPEGHPIYGKDYNAVTNEFDKNELDLPHGSFTYAEKEKDGWWVGWDYAHAEDFEFESREVREARAKLGFSPTYMAGRMWTLEEIRLECIWVIRGLRALEKKQ